jgi:hypothetical protein
MAPSASDLVYRLGREAEAVCRHYLSNGRRQGRYWLVGDVQNNPGRSMFVRLTGYATGKGAAGKWTDAATGEHGDLLDVIAASCGLVDFADIIQEASRFLALPVRCRTRDPGGQSHHVKLDLKKRPAGFLPCRARSGVTWRRRICIGGASHRSMTPDPFASIPAATIGLMITARPKFGRRWSPP